MKARSAWIQGLLAAAGLLLAYVTWQRPKETVGAERVKVLEATKQSLEKVRMEDGTRFVELVRQGGGDTPTFWVTQGFLPGKEPVFDAGAPEVVAIDGGELDGGADGGATADGGAAAPAHPLVSHAVVTPPPEPTPTRKMRGGERALEIFNKLTPFEATRALGVLPGDKLTEVGLTGSTRTLTITVAGVARRFAIAKPQVGLFGWYIQDEQSKSVYLLEASLLSDLDPTSQVLVDRRLHTFRLNEFDTFTLSAQDKRQAYVHRAPDNIANTVTVAKQESPDTAEELVKNWHDKVFARVVVTEVLGEGEQPKAGAPEVQLRVDYTQKGSAKGFLELALDPKKGTWARSENTAGWVAVHQASDELILEALRFLGAKLPE